MSEKITVSDRLNEALARVHAQAVEIKRLKGVLSKAAATFRTYEKLHTLKPVTPETLRKTQANREMAILCEEALSA